MWSSLYSKGISTFIEAHDQTKLDLKIENMEEEKRKIEEHIMGLVRRGTKKGMR